MSPYFLIKMTKVTYLLGAGASFEVLPLAKTIKDQTGKEHPGLGQRMGLLANEIKELSKSLSREDSNNALSFIEGLIWLQKEADIHGTIDTFAKKLFLQKDFKTLNKLKTHLSLFFIIEQRTKGYDKRYISFFASILEQTEDGICMPSNINILTWNYDLQLEMAFQYYHRKDNHSNIKSSQLAMNSIPNYDFLLSNKACLAGIVHLNGIAGLYLTEDGKANDIYDRSEDSKIQKLEEALRDNLFILESAGRTITLDKTFQFAWENTAYDSPLLNSAKNIALGTSILVIIGYSFPFFNRNIDRILFHFMKNSIDKIYFQDPVLDGSFLRAQFDLSKNFNIEHIKETNQFFLPYEL
ncbi:MAG: hypothetical protein M3R17_11110 [Bacteroidota bacterium]|nr:hypothetical protein [Bacteroidota bacterium]